MFNLANKLTLLRMLLVPLVIVLLYFQGPVTCVLAALAFIAASITDLRGPAQQHGHQHGQVP